ncbi:hypothetical protein FB45DRAFT_1063957 [Roridomyces roridus]|uniref:Uncharacterized protein n=1 Tax=Roridomyces roridus TaxID=1738132 RepID=A0AAD7BCF4_9AGAR|nr:hypothetical protein FB45DRAFT_1063957 [Roridomyces roridus]
MSAAGSVAMLPPELERQVFELAAYTQPHCIPRLMRVAWRVKEWVEPLLYRVILLSGHPRGLRRSRTYPHEDDEGFTRTLSISPEILRTCVRHLCVNDSPRLVDQLLASCTSVTDYWGFSPCAANLGSLPQLTRLSTQLALVFLPHPIDFTHSLFSRITHLQVFDPLIPRDLAIWCGLGSLPQLTHLAFSHGGYVNVFPELLRTPLVPQVPEALARQPRFVCMWCVEYVRDWHTSALGGGDFWERAEELVRKRRSGEVDPMQFYILEDASLHLP